MSSVPEKTRATAVEAARNPLAFIAARWTPSPGIVRRAALTALVMAVVIVVTGGAVRLTGSGLGCPTWPKCTEDSLTSTREMGLHGAIEFGNRMLTYVLCAAVGWAIIAARSAKPRRRALTRLGWAQFWVVMGNAILGGIVVLVGLNPYTVAAHFLLSTALIALATVMWQRTGEGDEAGPAAGRQAAAPAGPGDGRGDGPADRGRHRGDRCGTARGRLQRRPPDAARLGDGQPRARGAGLGRGGAGLRPLVRPQGGRRRPCGRWPAPASSS